MTYPVLTKERMNRELSGENEKLAFLFGKFTDVSLTSNSRATFYNSEQEQIQASIRLHEEFLNYDRLLYSLCLMLPGTTDFSMMTGVRLLLSNPLSKSGKSDFIGEKKLITWLVQSLPPQRMIKLFDSFRAMKINNARTRSIILWVLLNSRKLELWSVKYRSKIKVVLYHTWGKRTAGIIVSILSKRIENLAEKEKAILKKNIDCYIEKDTTKEKVYRCISFIFGNENNPGLPLLKAYAESKVNIDSGRFLPYEVLEGIRSTFHPQIKNEYILELTKARLTDNQKMAFQRKAENSNIKIEFNPENYDSARLYRYAYEMGMTDNIRKSLSQKAADSAFLFCLEGKKSAVLIDCSESMTGSETQRMHPIAAALALRDVIVKASASTDVFYCGGTYDESSGLAHPSGDTSLAEGFVELLAGNPDTVFIISDGYENSPAGRLDEVIQAASAIGINPNIIQYSPVMASETHGIRELSGTIRALPFSSPESSATGLLKEAFASDPGSGFKILLKYIKPALIKAKIDEKLLTGV